MYLHLKRPTVEIELVCHLSMFNNCQKVKEAKRFHSNQTESSQGPISKKNLQIENCSFTVLKSLTLLKFVFPRLVLIVNKFAANDFL